jgi:hypothetical protein
MLQIGENEIDPCEKCGKRATHQCLFLSSNNVCLTWLCDEHSHAHHHEQPEDPIMDRSDFYVGYGQR